jgi:hypothetical protein
VITALVVAQTVVVALLALLVVSLLRSHAEILRRLHEIDPVGGAEHDHGPAGPTPVDFGVRPGVALPRETETPAYDVQGTSAAGEEVGLALVGARSSTLLAFLSSGCMTCLDFWHAFAREDHPLPQGIRLVVLTKGPEQESASRVAELAPPGVQVVMSTQAWVDYQVPMAPYFLLVDGPAGVVRGEGAASSWRQLVDLMGQALADSGRKGKGARRTPVGPAERESRIDAELLAAGIRPGDPSLHANPFDDAGSGTSGQR